MSTFSWNMTKGFGVLSNGKYFKIYFTNSSLQGCPNSGENEVLEGVHKVILKLRPEFIE